MNAPQSTMAHRHFHGELGYLKQRLLDMSRESEHQVELSIRSLLDREINTAEHVVVGDKIVNSFEVEIEQRAIRLLALQQPMARDLRFLVGVIKVSSDLERIGDHAVGIAKSAIKLADFDRSVIPAPEIEDMAARARSMLADALQAFLEGDAGLGRTVCKAGDAVESLNDSVFRTLLTHMLESGRKIAPSLELLLVSNNLDRVAALATNIAEDAVYLAEGKQIKHHFED